MIVTPRHQPQKRKKVSWAADDPEVILAPTPGPTSTPEGIPSTSDPALSKAASRDNLNKQGAPTGSDTQGIQPQTNATAISAEQVLKNPQEEFDEYGTELGAEARVWKTYVKEADRYDTEKVEEWNKSMDVILIFAALFSAVSTTFVMESSKKLKEDPIDASSQTLLTISQTLIAIANNSPNLAVPSSTASTHREFTPSRSDICVNILWFLSLSISIAVSLIAMLAKEWCYIFMSGRTGHPCAQARRRQQRWDALKQWKMPEVLMFLPSLIHLALHKTVFFAVGLCIHLWNMHFGVAVPVLLVTLAALGVYMASTILPLVRHLCPYSTAVSRFITSFRKTVVGKSDDGGSYASGQDVISSKALRWLIEKCEDPRSVDTALQAIAGADENLPLDELKECDAVKMVCQRMIAGSNYSRNYEVVFKLYARAIAVLKTPTRGPVHEQGKYNDVNELRRQIRNLQTVTERTIAALLVTKELPPTHSNLLALRIGSTATLYSLESLSYGPQDQPLEYWGFNSAVDLLERHWSNTLQLHPAALQSLIIGTAVLLSCSVVYSDASTIAPFVARLCTACPNPNDQVIGILLTAFLLARNDYPGWNHPSPLGNAARAERAIDVIAYYAPSLNVPTQIPSGSLKTFGLLELLLNARAYHIVHGEVELAFNPRMLTWVDDPHVIHTFPSSFNLRQYVGERMAQKLSRVDEDEVYSCENLVEAYLLALSFTYDHWVGGLALQVYVFALESICRVPSSRVFSMSSMLVTKLSASYPSSDLAALVQRRNIIPLLANSLSSCIPHVRNFATTQLLAFVQLILRTPHGPGSPWVSLLVNQFRCEELCNPRQRLQAMEEALADEITRISVEGQSDRKGHSDIHELKIKLRELQGIKSQIVHRWLAIEEYKPTRINQSIIRAGDVVTPVCLQALCSTHQNEMFVALKSAIRSLETSCESHSSLHVAALRSLVISTATLISCSVLFVDSSTVASCMVRLLHAELSDDHLGVLLAAFALTQNDNPGWMHLDPLGDTARTSRAIDFVTHYAPMLETPEAIPSPALKNLGLMELLFNSTKYGLVDKDFEAIYTEFESIWDDEVPVIHSFSSEFNFGQYVLELITRKIYDVEVLDSVLASQMSVQAHLDVLRCTYTENNVLTPEVYGFVLESLCCASSCTVEIIGEQLATQFPFPVLSNRLAELIADRNLATLLTNALESNSMRVKVFATAQVCLFIELILHAPAKLGKAWKSLLTNMFGCEELCCPLARLRTAKDILALELENMRSEFPHFHSATIYVPEVAEAHSPTQDSVISMLPVENYPPSIHTMSSIDTTPPRLPSPQPQSPFVFEPTLPSTPSTPRELGPFASTTGAATSAEGRGFASSPLILAQRFEGKESRDTLLIQAI